MSYEETMSCILKPTTHTIQAEHTSYTRYTGYTHNIYTLSRLYTTPHTLYTLCLYDPVPILPEDILDYPKNSHINILFSILEWLY